jgi:NCS1 nucleoside transporter family
MRTFESTGIERVPESVREHRRPADMLFFWWSANCVLPTVALGITAVAFGLSFIQTVLLSVAATLAGSAPVAFFATLGPRTGLAQMTLSRFSFGLDGARVPATLNAMACVGWSTINAAIGGALLATAGLPGGFTAAVLLLALVATVISAVGYFAVHLYQRYAWALMGVLLAYVFAEAAPAIDLGSGGQASGAALIASAATFGSAAFGYALSWAPYAADYTRRMPEAAPRPVFLYTCLGIAIPCIVLEVGGYALASAAPAADGVGDVIATALGTGSGASVVLGLLAFGAVANNVPNDYSFALSMQAAGLHVRRWVLTIAGAFAYVVFALAFGAGIVDRLAETLLLLAYWLGPWCAIVLVDHRFRRGRYPVQDYADASRLPHSAPGLVAMGTGLAACVLGVSQAMFVGPIADRLSGADIGFPLAIASSAGVYYVLRQRSWPARPRPTTA